MYSNPNIIEVHIPDSTFFKCLTPEPYNDQYGEGIATLMDAGFVGRDNIVVMYKRHFNMGLSKDYLGHGDLANHIEVNDDGTIQSENLEYILKGGRYETNSGLKNIFIVGRYWDGCHYRAFNSICKEVLRKSPELMHLNFHFVVGMIDDVDTGSIEELISLSKSYFFAQESSAYDHSVFVDAVKIDWKRYVSANTNILRFDLLLPPPNLSTINIYFWSSLDIAKKNILENEI